GALIQPVPDQVEFARRSYLLRVGEAIDLENLSAWLVAHGYRRVDAVEYPAEFSRRGGIVDIFSPEADAPVRFEFFGDEIESIRRFPAQTQRSLEDLQGIAVLGFQAEAKSTLETGHFCDYLPPDSWIVLVEPEEIREQGKLFLDRAPE